MPAKFGYPLAYAEGDDGGLTRGEALVQDMLARRRHLQHSMYNQEEDSWDGDESYGEIIIPAPPALPSYSHNTITKNVECDMCDDFGYCTRYSPETLFLCPACRREKFEEERHHMAQPGPHHMILRLKGAPEFKELFYGIASSLDTDWPIRANRTRGATVPSCKVCKGLIYRNPFLDPNALKRLALQCGVKLKIQSWIHQSKCGHSAGVEQVAVV